MELIYTCYRITDIDRAVAFHEALGFEERRRMPIGDEAINVFMGLPGEGDRLELTYNFGIDSYDLGAADGHIAVAVDDLDATLARLAEKGIAPEKPPYRVREPSCSRAIPRPRPSPSQCYVVSDACVISRGGLQRE
jgi:lactoylglutathione lyase